jgi:hypothetical protein
MRKIDVGPHGLLAGPIEMRVHESKTCPLDEPDEKAGREHVRHLLELGGFRVEARHRFRRGYDEAMLDAKTRAEGVLHAAEDRAASNAVPALSRTITRLPVLARTRSRDRDGSVASSNRPRAAEERREVPHDLDEAGSFGKALDRCFVPGPEIR